LLINPQIVNISSTFTGAALCMAVLSFALHARIEQPRSAWTVGLLLAGLCALKSSFVLLSVSLIAAHGGAIWLGTRSPARALRWMLVCVGAWGLFLLPWLLVHVSSYLASLTAVPALPAPAPFEPYSVDPFSNETSEANGYGDGFLPYTAATLVCLGLGVFGVAAAAERSTRALLGLAVAIGLGAVYVTMLYVVGPEAQGSTTSLRLFVPMLIGVMPGLLLFASDAARARHPRVLLVPVLVVGAALLPFSIGFPGRVVQALRQGSLLGFRALAEKPWYVEYNQHVLHGRMRQQVEAAQAAVPIGAAMIAWINAPFWLDYARNPIHDLDLAGLETPWAAVPATAYVIWEYNGVATPQMRGYELESKEPGALQARIAAAGMRMAYAMIDLARHSTIIYDDHQIMVLRLAKTSALQERYRGR
jgi:hypothetical protein